MEMKWVKPAVIGAAIAALGVGVTPQAFAQLNTADSYVVGAGGYTNNTSLASQGSVTGSTIKGFLNTTGGSGTSNFQTQAVGLAYAPAGINSTDSGKVGWIGANADSVIRSTARNMTAVPAASTYYISFLLNRSPLNASDSGFVLTGFGNAGTITTGSTNLRGLFAGFSGTSGDLVLRYRNTSGTTQDSTLLTGLTDSATYDVVARLDVNTSGTTDNITYWVNPTDFTSDAALSSTSLATGSLTADTFLTSADFVRLNYYAQNWNTTAYFDEPRLGILSTGGTPASALGISVASAAAPEPGSLALVGVGGMSLLGALLRRRRSA